MKCMYVCNVCGVCMYVCNACMYVCNVCYVMVCSGVLCYDSVCIVIYVCKCNEM